MSARIVEVYNSCKKFKIDAKSVELLYWHLDRVKSYKAPSGSLSVSFVSEKKIADIHQKFLKDPAVTDVITFPGDPEFDFAGEVITCPSYALRQSKCFETQFEKELTLYLVHGFLHLCGLKDKLPEDAKAMRAAESVCMKALGDFTLKVQTLW